MDHQEVVQYIARADTTGITEILDMAIARYRILYPDWDILYYAEKKSDRTGPEQVAQLLQRLRSATE